MEDHYPLVSIIILCYNQEKYVCEAIDSALNQTYDNLEIIIYDDGSTDDSVNVINGKLENIDNPRFIDGKQNLGNCIAFNRAFSLSKGKYIIDLAADDVLMPDRVRTGVKQLEKYGPNYGVHYGNAAYIDENGQYLSRETHKNLPSGDIYKELIEHYFVNTASMMMSRKVLKELGGYNESLSYEDFDFWIRSAREYKYIFNPDILVCKRRVRNSLSSQQFKWRNKHQISTYSTINRIKELNQSPEENKALKKRIQYEIRQSLRCGNFTLVLKYFRLLFTL